MKLGMQHLVIKPGEGLRVSLLIDNKWADIVDLRIPHGNELIETEDGDIVEGDKPRTDGHLFTYEIDLYGVDLSTSESWGGKSATPESEGKDNGNSN